MRKLPLIFFAALLPAVLASCEPTKPPQLAGGGMDMFTPVKMRLHPLSRAMINAGKVDIEARLEFTDQFGDICKGVGSVSLQLCAYQPLTFDHRGSVLEQWSADILTPQQNQAAWDAITRTYLFRHSLSAGVVGRRDQAMLVAVVTLPNGQKLSAMMSVPIK